MPESVVNPARVKFTGQNPFLRLKRTKGTADTTTCAFWRAHLSPAGPGHAVFVQSDATDGKVLVLSDNESLARWLQQIEAILRPPFGDKGLPIAMASFSSSGDPRSVYAEHVRAADVTLELAWGDLYGPFLISLEPGNNVTADWGVSSCMIPARWATLTVNGRKAAGQAFPEPMAGQDCSTSALAFAENWYRAD
jgi:hypothetical protein